MNASRWRIKPIIAIYNGPGLRDRAVLLADGRTIYFAYGEGRYGLSAAFGARIRIASPPSPTPTPTPPRPRPRRLPDPDTGPDAGTLSRQSSKRHRVAPPGSADITPKTVVGASS